MNKLTKLFLLLASFTGFSQEQDTSKAISFANSFQFTLGFSNLAANKSMMGDAHQEAFPAISARLGIFSYNRFTLGIHAGVFRMSVKETPYFGQFERTTVFNPGFYASYYHPISTQGLFEPYFSYDYAEYFTKGYGKELDSDSNGLGFGLDYQHKISTSAYVTFGVKYTWNKMSTQTNPNWEKYINNYQYLSAKLGFTFSKNRL